ncbi:hypothetical protein EVAR_85875_1 [Eumeta japonica]|uniref:Uncharacterized protein n=1 Tax=Eumeta variegata TaxID=151549 RepID=A0A4C2A7A5_EUMVA|nr:hypothetical protein EVAR_85875_1 [Eumeta japonica]
MSVGYEKGNVEDYPKHSSLEKHKIVMYEDREKSQFLHKYDPACSTTPIDSWGHPVKDPEEMSGWSVSESKSKLKRDKTAKRKSYSLRAALRDRKSECSTTDKEKPRHLKKITNDSPKSSPKPTKADLREVKPPIVMPVEN